MTLPGELGGVGFPPLCGRLSGYARGSLFYLREMKCETKIKRH